MDDKIAEFLGVTGTTDTAKAAFFLESVDGDVAMAVNAFFGENYILQFLGTPGAKRGRGGVGGGSGGLR